jgi:hypothetical protein
MLKASFYAFFALNWDITKFTEKDSLNAKEMYTDSMKYRMDLYNFSVKCILILFIFNRINVKGF